MDYQNMVNNENKKKVKKGEHGVATEERNELSGDRPLENPKDDRLGYASFAKHLAQAIREMVPAEGIVISINGPWGSGKTTVLNFIKFYLEQISEDNKAEVICFNPWWFSGWEDFTQGFFSEVSQTIDPRNKTVRQIKKILINLGKFVDRAPKPGGFLTDFIVKTFTWLSRLCVKTKPGIAELRRKAAELLQSQEQRFVVFIDDVDRLNADEVRELFRTIKAIAGLPNIVYVVAFDKQVVTSALGSMQGLSGKDYLEKIVQLPFDLPLPDRTSIRQILFERLDSALGPLDDSEFDQQRWANIFLDGIDPLIKTTRDIMRLCNSIRVSFAAVHGEVNPVDFIAIESIRIFLPDVYESIRTNREEFTGTSERNRYSDDQSSQKFHQAYLDSLDESLREPVKLLLQRLFPKLEKVSYARGFENEWRRQLRVCSDELFPVYFRLQLSKGEIGSVDMRLLLDAANDKAEVVRYLRSLISQKHRTGVTRARALLERLEDYTEKEIPEESIKPMLLALFDVGDELRAAEPERQEMYDFGVGMQIARIIYQLLKRLSEEDRFNLMKTAINEGQGIVTVIYEIDLHDRKTEKAQKNEDLTDVLFATSEIMEQLKKLAADRIAKEAEEGTLLKCVNLILVLHCWKMWDKSGKYQKWISTKKSHREFIVPLLTSSLGVSFSAGMGMFGLGDRVAKREYRIDLNFIEEFVELNETKQIIEKTLQKGNFSDRERLAMETFLKELKEKSKKENNKTNKR
jgi:predicted KAP-like P-loop ATPase